MEFILKKLTLHKVINNEHSILFNAKHQKMNLLDLVQQVMKPEVLSSLNKQLPQAQPQQTQTATQLAMSTLFNALAKNVQSDKGLQGLVGALNRDHEQGNILQDLSKFVVGDTPQSKATDGVGILSHLFGGNIFNIVELISKGSGLNRNNSMNMLVKLAPVALGLLGNVKQQNNLQADGLKSLLMNTVQEERKQRPESTLIEKLLDKNGDGNIKDDVMQMGMKALGNLLRVG